MGTYLLRCIEVGREQQERLGKQRRDLASVVAARWPDATITTSPGRIFVEGADDLELDLATLAGMSSVSPCTRVPHAELHEAVVALARRVLSPTTTFAVRVKRDRRSTTERTLDIQRSLADAIVTATNAPVDLRTPSTTIGVELRDGAAYIFDQTIDGIDRTGPAARRAPGEPRFLADQMLGRLAARLRLLGFDTTTVFDIADSEVTRRAAADGRILLTRDGPLSRTLAVPVYFVESIKPSEQLAEVIAALQLEPSPARLFTRCTLCNGTIAKVDEAAVTDRLPPSVRGRSIDLFQCASCSQVYWHGSQVDRILDDLATSGVRTDVA